MFYINIRLAMSFTVGSGILLRERREREREGRERGGKQRVGVMEELRERGERVTERQRDRVAKRQSQRNGKADRERQ